MIFVDSNVLIDVITPDQAWCAWSDKQLASASETMDLVVNQIVLAEVAANFPHVRSLRYMLDSLDIEVLPLTDDVAFAAGKAFRAYRRDHRDRNAMLSDFIIGGHARSLGAPLLTRDTALYRTYFADLPLITPETHP